MRDLGTEYNLVYESNLEEILMELRSKKPCFIVIDGRDGSGKTYLGRQINISLGGTRLTETDYRYFEKEVFKVDIKKINDDLSEAKHLPVVLDCCLIQEYTPDLLVKPDVVIYVKSLEPDSGDWKEGDDLYSAEKEPSVFRQQMKDYHKRYHPDEKANLIYVNQLKI